MITQAKRPLRVTTELGVDAVVLERLSGEEAISAPFRFTLDLLSDRAIDPTTVLRTSMTVAMDLPGGSVRYLNGRVSRFAQLGQSGGLTSYRAEVVPWLWFATLASDWRIFQNKSVPEILEEVFLGLGISDYDLRLMASYEPREYTVQFGETTFEFMSRLMEE
jgi:type VI secretion system secreted protein VgrG